MRFALFTTTFFPITGGAEKQLHLLATQLVRRGHQPVVIAPEIPHRDNTVKGATYPIVRFPRLRSKRWLLRWHARFLEALHRKHRFDIIHAHGAYPAAYMVHSFAQRHRLPLVVRAYGGDVLPGESVAGHWWLRLRLIRALRAADCLIAQNAELQTILAQLSGHPDRVVRIPNGVEIDEYATASPPPEPDDAHPPYACTLSTLYPKKGLDVLIEAWAQLRASHPRVQLKIAGHGPLAAALQTQIDNLGLNGAVSLLGDVKGRAKLALLQHCHVYVSSARREPFSNALLEAIAAGCPVVATRTGGNIEILETTQAGELVPPEDPTALAQALQRAFDRPRPHLTPDACKKRIAPYALDQIIDLYLSNVLSLCATSPSPSSSS